MPRKARVITGDCSEVLSTVEPGTVDLVVTDPPYLIRYRDRAGREIANDDRSSWLLPAFTGVARVLKPNSYCISFYGFTQAEKFISAWKEVGLRPIGHIVWHKPYSSGGTFLRYHHECAYVLAKGRPPEPNRLLKSVQPWEYSGNTLHPTQKPVSALKPLIDAFSVSGDLVLDPFCGSGSTGVAALSLDRRFVGIEVDSEHAKTARKRIAAVEKAR